jgi:hypothetical protein
MSISQLLQPNGYNINVNSLSIKDTILDSQNTQYTLVLPNDNDIGPLSIILVDSIVGDKVYLKFSAPINPPQAPFNYIECNTLKANVEVISRSLTIDNISGGSSTFTHEGTADIVYRLPLASPSQNNQILSVQTNGNMSWTTPPTINNNILPSDTFFFSFPNAILNQDNPEYIQSQSITSLIGNTYYKAFFSFTGKKLNPTGVFVLTVVPYIIGIGIIQYGETEKGIHPNTVTNEISFGDDVPEEQGYTRSIEYIFKTPEDIVDVPYIQYNLVSDIEAGGVLEINQVIVSIYPIKRV